MDDELVAAGRYARLDLRGRRSGRRRSVTVGFVEHPDGTLLVAGLPNARWTDNLMDDPHCRITIAGRTWSARAEPLDGPEFAAAIRELILRYGTPAERLGLGPAFRLRPVSATDEENR
jgi:deazaflavin-dependent oxidoreductase (nitroreductase family)